MHGMVLGVARQIWELWTKPGTPYYLRANAQAEINRRLLNIQPPQEIHRLPRSSKSRSKWKASEWYSWLLFYSIPCLTGILQQDALKSWSLFVRCIHKLLSVNITETHLIQCDIDSITFVGDCQIMYGKGAMTFNLHSVLHIVQSVRASGPLWATSAFPFESGIYYLKRQIHGPKGINDQIVKGTLQMNIFQNRVASMPEDNTCTVYCKGLFSNHKVSTFTRICNGVLLIGNSIDTRGFTLTIDGEIVDVIGESFKKCIYKGIVLHSTRYTRSFKTKDTIVQLQCDSIAEIIQLYAINGKCYIEYVKLLTTPVEIEENELITHLFHILGKEESVELLPIDNVKCKCIFIDVFDDTYIAVPPNVFEIQ